MNIHDLILQIQGIDDLTGLYLLTPLSDDSGFFSTNGKLLYISSDSEQYASQGIETDYLTLQTHINIKAVRNNQTFNDGIYNIITFKGDLYDPSAESFVNLCSVHARDKLQLGFRDFFYSLITIFQLPSEQGYKNAVGLFGELSFMKYVFDLTGIDISDNWHRSGSMSRYDFSNGKSSIEVKTTSSECNDVTIKHTQIFGSHPCYLAVVCCERYDNGKTINELIDEMQKIGQSFTGLNFCINLARELKRISGQEAAELRFSVRGIDIYYNEDVNPFPILPENISNLVYKLDLSLYDALDEGALYTLTHDFQVNNEE